MMDNGKFWLGLGVLLYCAALVLAVWLGGMVPASSAASMSYNPPVIQEDGGECIVRVAHSHSTSAPLAKREDACSVDPILPSPVGKVARVKANGTRRTTDNIVPSITIIDPGTAIIVPIVVVDPPAQENVCKNKNQFKEGSLDCNAGKGNDK
jgi:hypothetical protein